MTDYITVTAPAELVQSVDAFLQAVDNRERVAADHFIEMMDHLTDRLLNLFLAEPREFLELSGTQRRVMDFAISTASKASHMLTRQIYKKKTSEELAPVAANVRAMYWPADQTEDGQARMVFPVEKSFADEFRQAADACARKQGSQQLDQVDRVMDGITDGIIENFFLRNAHEVKIGYVLRKSLDASIDGTKKAVHSVIHKVLRNLDDEHLSRFMGHYEPVLQQK